MGRHDGRVHDGELALLKFTEEYHKYLRGEDEKEKLALQDRYHQVRQLTSPYTKLTKHAALRVYYNLNHMFPKATVASQTRNALWLMSLLTVKLDPELKLDIEDMWHRGSITATVINDYTKKVFLVYPTLAKGAPLLFTTDSDP